VEKMIEIYERNGDLDEGMNMQDDLTIILVVGVNGVGKTTSIGKLAHRYKSEGKNVMLAAADTFRAGAINQLQVWGDRVDADVIKHQEGSDPAAVVFDAVNAAKRRGTDVLIVDTAGRLQNKGNLMKELEKMKRVIQRVDENAPHEVLLVLDATTGQNAMLQAKSFNDVTELTGMGLTKLDGTAKGGIVLERIVLKNLDGTVKGGIVRAIKNELGIPVKYVGLGEKNDDLEIFSAENYVYGLFADMIDESGESPDDERTE